jgi:UDP-4-amino-4-deoxy-L-arabinose-oxoglutarate aminotransferase
VSLNRQGIGAAVNYRAVHGLTYFRERLERPVARWGELPVAEEMGDRTLSLPLYPTLADDAVDEVARALRAALEAP